MFLDTNRAAKAEPFLRRALDIHEKLLGPDHPYIVLSLSNLAYALIKMNRLAEAEPLLQRALPIAETKLGPQDPYLGITLSHFARLLHIKKQPDKAEGFLRRALIIILGPTAQSGCPHPKLRKGIDRYRQILQECSISEEEINRRFQEIGHAAGFSPESFRKLNEQIHRIKPQTS